MGQPTITTTTVRPPEQPVRVAPPVAPPAPAASKRIPPQLNFNECAKPEYTTAARRAEAQGKVAIAYTLDVDGRITEASIETSSGPSPAHKQLDEATLKAVLTCTGRPATVDGKPERYSGRIEYVWKLVGDDPVNRCLALSSAQYLQAGRRLIPSNSDFTIEFRFFLREHKGGFSEVISQGQQPHAFYMGINPEREIRLGDSWERTGVYMPLNEWVRYSFVYRADGRAEFYFNGMLAGQRSRYQWNTEGTETRVGAQSLPGAPERIDGCIDDLKIWKTARSSEQIARSSPTHPTGGDERNLIAHYSFNLMPQDGMLRDHTGKDQNSLKPLGRPLLLASSDNPFFSTAGAASAGEAIKQTQPLAVTQSSLPPCQESGVKHNCVAVTTFSNGSSYVGEFKNDKRNGLGTLLFSLGPRYVGEFRDGFRHGEGIEYEANGSVRQFGKWRDGYLDISYALDPKRFPFNRHEELVVAIEAERKRRNVAEVEDRERAKEPHPVPPRSERRVALVIGNAGYKKAPLVNPVNDAVDVASSLRSMGFDTTLVRDATLAQMRSATRQFADAAISSDVALIFFAGHGIEAKGRNYVIPVSAEIKHEYELEDEAFDAGRWLDMLEGLKAGNRQRVNIVILDACRNNEFARSWRSTSRGLARMDAPTGTFVAFATAPGKVAADGARGQRNSPFTRSLLKAMQTPDLPIELMFKEVRRLVIEETKNEQVPWENSSLVGDFVFKRSR